MTDEERKKRILVIETKELPELKKSMDSMLAKEDVKEFGPQEQRGFETLMNLQRELQEELKRLKEGL
jgi:uncharacterized sporulation protein YeaH/YhbH (DUF444 family)